MTAFLALLRRDLSLAWREGGAVGTALGFYLVVVSVLPFGVGADLALLTRMAPGVLWVALLLAALLSMGRLFESDSEDGSIEAIAMGPLPLELVVTAKCLAHWISTVIPLVLAAPVLGLLLNLELDAYGVLLATMLAGTPAVSFIGSVGAALTLRARRAGLLVALIIMPLYVPTLVFGISAMGAAVSGMPGFQSAFLILTALSLASVALAPIATAAALRLQLQS